MSRFWYIPTMHNKEKIEVFRFHSLPFDIDLNLEKAQEHINDICLLNYNPLAELIVEVGINILVDLTESIRIGMVSSQNEHVKSSDYIITNEPVPINVCIKTNMRVLRSYGLPASQGIFLNLNTHRLVTDGRYSRPPNLCQHYNISDDAFVYGCFNQAYAIDARIVGVWTSILKHAKVMAMLVLLKYSEHIERALRTESKIQDINLDMLRFISYLQFEEHIHRYFLMDLYLETASFDGKCIIGETLLIGTLAIFIAGEKESDRIGSSILQSWEFGNLVVTDLS